MDNSPDIPDDTAEQAREADEARRRRRRVRIRRLQGAFFAFVVLAVVAIGTAAGAYYYGLWEWPVDDATVTAPVAPCPTPTPTTAPIASVVVNVYNSTDRAGLAGGVAQVLTERGFTVEAVDNDPVDVEVSEAAQVRHGPEGVLAARTVAAQVAGSVLVDDARAGTVVDVALGTGYQQLRSPTEAEQLVQPAPIPSPAGCVISPASTPATPPTVTVPSDGTSTGTTGPTPTSTG